MTGGTYPQSPLRNLPREPTTTAYGAQFRPVKIILALSKQSTDYFKMEQFIEKPLAE